MFGDDSKLRLRRHISGDPSSTILPMTSAHRGPANNNNGNNNNNNGNNLDKGKGLRKRRRRRKACKSFSKTLLSGICATLLSASLSLLLLPFSWRQVDYHHQVQNAATHLIQVVQQNRRNYQTAVRGKHAQQQRRVVCDDGTIGFENDDYCDCPDGSDEPMTSACSHKTIHQKTFVCKIDRSITIYASRVKDGVKDCPDGSDEQ